MFSLILLLFDTEIQIKLFFFFYFERNLKFFKIPSKWFTEASTLLIAKSFNSVQITITEFLSSYIESNLMNCHSPTQLQVGSDLILGQTTTKHSAHLTQPVVILHFNQTKLKQFNIEQINPKQPILLWHHRGFYSTH